MTATEPDADVRRGLPSASALPRLSKCAASWLLSKEAARQGIVEPSNKDRDIGERMAKAMETDDETILSDEEKELATRMFHNRTTLLADWHSPLWKGDPDQQLFYYSSRAMCRRHFPDVLLGIYTPEEMAEAIDVTATVREVPPARPQLFGPKTDVAPFPLDSLPPTIPGTSAGRDDAASPSNGVVGTDSPSPATSAAAETNKGETGAGTGAAAENHDPSMSPSFQKALKRRATKEGNPPFTLSDEPESTYQRLTRKIGEAGLVHAKVENWLSHNDFPPLSMLSQTDAEQVLELFGALAEEAKA